MGELETPRVVAGDQLDPVGLVLVEGRLAWGGLGPPPAPGRRRLRVLRSAPLEGGAARDLVEDVHVQGLVGDAAGFAWRDQAGDGQQPPGAQLLSAPPDGGRARLLQVGRPQLHALGLAPDALVGLEGPPLQAALLRARRALDDEPAGEPTPIVPACELTRGAALVVRDGRVWWTGQSAVESVTLDGLDRRRVAPARGGPLALDATHVYFVAADGAGLARVPRAGGAVERLADARDVAHLAVDATHLYWTTRGSGGRSPAGGRLCRVPKGGSAPRLLARSAHGLGPVVVAGATVVWVDLGLNAEALLLQAIFGGGPGAASAGAILALPTSSEGLPLEG